MDPGEQPVISAPPPDWNAIESDVFCPLCDYNLRGLSEPRCPECGFRFDWPVVLDPTRRLHPYIFEHHPERNFRSFWQTALAGWLPRRFWTALHPAQPSRPRRLILYWCLAASTVLLAYVATFAAMTHLSTKQQVVFRARAIAYVNAPQAAQWRAQVIRDYGSVSAFANTYYPDGYARNALILLESEGFFSAFFLPLICILLWPWLNLASLLIFRISMRRAKIKTGHVLRCVVYCTDVIFWLGLVLLVLTPAHVLALQGIRWWLGFMTVSAVCCILLFAESTSYRLIAAYRLYLRFDHPAATVLLSHLVASLILLNIVAACLILTH
jgi:hypothetical protein